MADSIAYNMDCLAYMRTLPDNYFDLCVADPPYGAGFTEGGGCQGWFSKYHQDTQEKELDNQKQSKYWNRFGQRFDRYKHEIAPYTHTHTQAGNPLPEQAEHGLKSTGKKSYRGT